MLREKRKEIRKYQLLIFTTASISSTIKILETVDIDGVPSECQIWDIERLFRLCGSETGRQIIEINFKEHSKRGQGIPCIEASGAATDDFKSYLCIIPGTLLADIYDKYGSSLLEGNVRSFSFNESGCEQKNTHHHFYSSQNDSLLTITGYRRRRWTCSLSATSGGLFLVSARDFQIINGGQTTASLSSARYNYKRQSRSWGYFMFQMKLTVIERSLEDDDAATLVQNISRSSNSQNRVSDADFFSTHPFHVQMERCSQRPWSKGHWRIAV